MTAVSNVCSKFTLTCAEGAHKSPNRSQHLGRRGGRTSPSAGESGIPHRVQVIEPGPSLRGQAVDRRLPGTLGQSRDLATLVDQEMNRRIGILDSKPAACVQSREINREGCMDFSDGLA